MNTYRFFATVFGVCIFASTVHAQAPAGYPTTTGTTTTATGQTFNGGGGGGSGGGTGGAVGGSDPITTTAPTGPRSAAGSTTSIPSNSNVFATTYIDYLALGKPSLYAKAATGLAPPKITTSTFGQPIYGATGKTTGTGAAGTGTGTQTSTGFSTVGQPRAPAYITSLSSEMPFKLHTPESMLTDARAVINQSSYIDNKDIRITMEGGAVVLRGTVATEKERRVAETTLRITPGIREVRNMLTVR